MRLEDEWWRQAVCAQIGPEIFSATTGGSTRKAKAVCARCPVIGACMEAIYREEAGRGRHDLHGVRAGMTATERHDLIGHVCPGCRGERDRVSTRRCSTCQPVVDDRERDLEVLDV